ncbi:quinol:cytochrome C oxidoreductase [Planctomycetota bacterium]|nr:quinol:cytochrome C oxidoreductase [Planctomycetota bacterium]
MAEHGAYLDPIDAKPLGSKAKGAALFWIAIGVVGLLAAFIFSFATEGSVFSKHMQFAYLAGFAFVLSIVLGALIFLILTHLFRAGWAVVVRRPVEAIANAMPLMLILFLPLVGLVLSGSGELYPWAVSAHHWEDQLEAGGGHAAASDVKIVTVADTVEDSHGEVAAGDHGEHYYPPEMMIAKRPYLNPIFFVIRWVVFFLLWIMAAKFYWRNSTKQDDGGDHTLTNKMEGWAPINTLVFALTITFASFDLLMSLDPVWFSTMFGVYYFTGAFLGAVCLTIIVIMIAKKLGVLISVNKEHMHDLGKLLFAFVFFWGYIAFSQYMLIWYGNLPEETAWYEIHGWTQVPDKVSGWSYVGLILLAGQLLIPFAGLLSRHVKRNMAVLFCWAVFLMVIHYVDVWWIIMPMFDSHNVTLGVMEIGCAVGMFGLLLGVTLLNFAKHSPVPVKDPRLHDSLGFHNI